MNSPYIFADRFKEVTIDSQVRRRRWWKATISTSSIIVFFRRWTKVSIASLKNYWIPKIMARNPCYAICCKTHLGLNSWRGHWTTFAQTDDAHFRTWCRSFKGFSCSFSLHGPLHLPSVFCGFSFCHLKDAVRWLLTVTAFSRDLSPVSLAAEYVCVFRHPLKRKLIKFCRCIWQGLEMLVPPLQTVRPTAHNLECDESFEDGER